MNKLKLLFSMTFFALFFTGCQAEIEVETLTSYDVEEKLAPLKYKIGLPNHFYGDSSQVFEYELTKTNPDINLKLSDVIQQSSGDSECQNISISNVIELSSTLVLSDCFGNGRLSIKIGSSTSFPILVDNLVDEQLAGPFDIVNSSNYLYVVDTGLDGIYSVNKSTGETLELSGPINGIGESFSTPTSLVLNTNETKFYVLDNSKRAVLEVDIANGNRTVISSSILSVGSGVDFSNPTRLVLNHSEDKIYVCSRGGGRNIIEIDIATGNRTVISSNSIGTGGGIDVPYGLEIGYSDNFLFFIDRNTRNLYQVEISSGDRILISDGNDNSLGPTLGSPHGLKLSSTGDYVFVNDQSIDAIIRIELSTGVRTIISDKLGVGDGPYMISSLGITLGEDDTAAYVVDSASGIDGVIKIDVKTGNRSYVTKKH